MSEQWLLPGAKRRTQSVTSGWDFVGQPLIDGVVVHEVRNVPTGYGYLTELYRSDWHTDDQPVDQVFQSVLAPGTISAWHVHGETVDRLFVTHGRMLLALFDARPDSPTHGLVNEFRFGTVRPALVVVPPAVWHGVKNVGWEPGFLVNAVDRAYAYEDPDHYAVPVDSPHVPYDIVAAGAD
jgi:dTDP-4-dehydrorhamnose 3,5-epimerase